MQLGSCLKLLFYSTGSLVMCQSHSVLIIEILLYISQFPLLPTFPHIPGYCCLFVYPDKLCSKSALCQKKILLKFYIGTVLNLYITFMMTDCAKIQCTSFFFLSSLLLGLHKVFVVFLTQVLGMSYQVCTQEFYFIFLYHKM